MVSTAKQAMPAQILPYVIYRVIEEASRRAKVLTDFHAATIHDWSRPKRYGSNTTR